MSASTAIAPCSSPAPCRMPTGAAPRAHRRVRADRHLGAVPAPARPRLPVRLRQRCPWHADHAQGAPGRHHARGADRALRAPSSSATSTAFDISFDNFHTTHSDENRELTHEIYRRLAAAGHIRRDTIRQAYDEQAKMFLPDRYVRGTCPNCGALDQYGDSCEVCGATYTPADLDERRLGRQRHRARAARVGAPVLQARRLRGDAARVDGLGPAAAASRRSSDEWFDAGLRDWDISRDAPYFGFEIPGENGKYFYVWLDAPIGYIGEPAELLPSRRARFRRATGSPTATPRSITSSARTSSTSTRCSGRRC